MTELVKPMSWEELGDGHPDWMVVVYGRVWPATEITMTRMELRAPCPICNGSVRAKAVIVGESPLPLPFRVAFRHPDRSWHYEIEPGADPKLAFRMLDALTDVT